MPPTNCAGQNHELKTQDNERNETRVAPVAMGTGPELESSSSAATDMEIQLQATDKREVGTVGVGEGKQGEHTCQDNRWNGNVRAG